MSKQSIGKDEARDNGLPVVPVSHSPSRRKAHQNPIGGCRRCLSVKRRIEVLPALYGILSQRARLKTLMNRAFQLLLLLALVTGPGCGGARLSHSEIRKQVAELGTSTLVPSAVSVRRIVNQSDKRLIAETTVDLAFQFERDSTASPWHIASVRLGDQNWVSVPELI